jgi:REP element-mobilizing transposase RayT
LHGTAKANGSVDRDHKAFGSEFLKPDEARRLHAESLLEHSRYVLNERAREVVRDAIVSLSQERNWSLMALHVRSNHVHLVIAAELDPSRLMSDLKARASRDLSRSGVDDHPKRWTRHGSTRYLFQEAELKSAVEYTLEQQGERMAAYHNGRALFD